MTSTKTIEFLRVTFLGGPNIWTYRSVIEAWIDIGDLEDHPSNTLPGFYERLTEWLPGLIEHHCSPGVRGGFLQRLQEGTWAAHILEHVTLELQNLAGVLLTMTPVDYCYLLDASRSVYFASDRGASVSFEAMVLVSQTEAEAQAKASREAHDAKKAAKVEA